MKNKHCPFISISYWIIKRGKGLKGKRKGRLFYFIGFRENPHQRKLVRLEESSEESNESKESNLGEGSSAGLLRSLLHTLITTLTGLDGEVLHLAVKVLHNNINTALRNLNNTVLLVNKEAAGALAVLLAVTLAAIRAVDLLGIVIILHTIAVVRGDRRDRARSRSRDGEPHLSASLVATAQKIGGAGNVDVILALLILDISTHKSSSLSKRSVLLLSTLKTLLHGPLLLHNATTNRHLNVSGARDIGREALNVSKDASSESKDNNSLEHLRINFSFRLTKTKDN